MQRGWIKQSFARLYSKSFTKYVKSQNIYKYNDFFVLFIFEMCIIFTYYKQCNKIDKRRAAQI